MRMGVISRDIISENFLGINLGGGAKFNKTQLELRIDKWKYFLAHRCDAKKGDKILIGIIDISVDFVALCFAAFELSLVIVIADEEPLRSISDKTIINPKMAQLMPLDILIRQPVSTDIDDSDTDLSKYSRKIAYYKNNSKFEIDLNEFYDTEFPEDLSVISAIRPDEDDLFMITTSSGTTGTAKVVKHTHKFFNELCKRNSKEFSGDVVHSRNIHHGSSLTVFYLPSLMSDAVTTHYFTSCHPNLYEHFVKQIAGIDINHISFPYVKILRDVMTICEQQRIKFPNLRVSLLSYVPEFSKKYIRELYVKEIQSIFGSNETAGPLFLSTMSMDNIDNFDSRSFSKVDDFYDMQIEDDVLTVTMPVYGTKIKTNDVFTVDGDQYTHQGRSDLVRINDITIDFNFFNTICNEYNDQIMLLTDTVENKIYLLIDKNPALSTNIDGIVEHINTRIRLYYSTHRLQIDKYAVEDFSAFLSGVKIDRELIRGYFRQYV
jgi:hypothetical protein